MSSPKQLFAPVRQIVRSQVCNVRLNPSQVAAVEKMVANTGCKSKGRLLLLAIGFAASQPVRFASYVKEVIPVPSPEQVDLT